jgi:hypothetical protein
MKAAPVQLFLVVSYSPLLFHHFSSVLVLILQHALGTETRHDIALYLRQNLAEVMVSPAAVQADSTRCALICNILVINGPQIGRSVLYLLFNGF